MYYRLFLLESHYSGIYSLSRICVLTPTTRNGENESDAIMMCLRESIGHVEEQIFQIKNVENSFE